MSLTTNTTTFDIFREAGEQIDADNVYLKVSSVAGGPAGNVNIASSSITLNVSIATPLPAGTNDIGKVDQGTGGTSAWKVDGSGVTQPVSAASLPLPTGASTSALQTTGNTSLNSIDGKLNSLGQKTMATSAPVVIASDQSAIPVSQSGTWTVGVSAGSAVIGHVITDSGSVTNATLSAETTKVIGVVRNADGSGNLLTSTSNALDVNLKTSSITLPISGTVTANAGTNLNTSALALDTSVNGLLLSQGSTTSGQKGPLHQAAVTTAAPSYTTAQTSPLSLNTAGGLRVDGSGVTQPISAASLPLPTGASTAANQSLQTTQLNQINTNTADVDAKTPNLGQAAGSASVPVVIASDQSTVPVAPKPQSGSTFAPSRAVTTVYATNLVVKASAGNLYTITGYNSKTTSQFIQVHNASSLPADTAVPIYTYTVPGQRNFDLDFSTLGDQFSTGIVVCNSSTGPTKTIGSADCWFVARYQ